MFPVIYEVLLESLQASNQPPRSKLPAYEMNVAISQQATGN